MCMSTPKIPDPPPPPAAPPPPTAMAKKVGQAGRRASSTSSKKRGTSALTVRRPSVRANSAGSGANVNY